MTKKMSKLRELLIIFIRVCMVNYGCGPCDIRHTTKACHHSLCGFMPLAFQMFRCFFWNYYSSVLWRCWFEGQSACGKSSSCNFNVFFWFLISCYFIIWNVCVCALPLTTCGYYPDGWLTVCTGKPSLYITNTKVNSAFRPSGVGKVNRVPACTVGVMAGHVYLCPAAGNTVWSHMAGDAPRSEMRFPWRAVSFNHYPLTTVCRWPCCCNYCFVWQRK